jgi:hypothetical protein
MSTDVDMAAGVGASSHAPAPQETLGNPPTIIRHVGARAAPGSCAAARWAPEAQQGPTTLCTWSGNLPQTLQVLLLHRAERSATSLPPARALAVRMPSSASQGRASPCRHADTCRDVDTSSSSPSIRHPAATAATLLILAFLEVSHRRVFWHRRCIALEVSAACMVAHRCATRL